MSVPCSSPLADVVKMARVAKARKGSELFNSSWSVCPVLVNKHGNPDLEGGGLARSFHPPVYNVHITVRGCIELNEKKFRRRTFDCP